MVVLPSGRLVRGRRWSDQTEPAPERGLYALRSDLRSPWPYTWLQWPNFGLPVSREEAWAGIERSWRATEIECVEVACGGRRGRTGTILAAMAMLDGFDADEAIDWVRTVYDRRAVETPWQHWWLQRR